MAPSELYWTFATLSSTVPWENPRAESTGRIHWQNPLAESTGRIHWQNPLAESTGRIHGQNPRAEPTDGQNPLAESSTPACFSRNTQRRGRRHLRAQQQMRPNAICRRAQPTNKKLDSPATAVARSTSPPTAMVHRLGRRTASSSTTSGIVSNCARSRACYVQVWYGVGCTGRQPRPMSCQMAEKRITCVPRQASVRQTLWGSSPAGSRCGNRAFLSGIHEHANNYKC